MIRRLLLGLAMGGGALVVAALVQDRRMLQAEAESVLLGRFDEAAERALRVQLLRPLMCSQLRAQLPGVVELGRRFPREAPLLEALHRLEPDTEEWQVRLGRLAALRARVSDITLGAVRFENPSPPSFGTWQRPAPHIVPAGLSYALFRYERLGPKGSDGESVYRLSRVGTDGRVEQLGTGRGSTWGQSWSISGDGTSVAIARPDDGTLELWNLVGSSTRWHTSPEMPLYVALGGTPGKWVVAFSNRARLGAEDVQRLFIWEDNSTRAVDLSGLGPRGRLSFDWDPRGTSLFALQIPADATGVRTMLPCGWFNRQGQLLTPAEVRRSEASRLPWWASGPGSTVGLSLGQRAWAWDGNSPFARLLPGISGPWAFSPDGKLLVGLKKTGLFVADAEDPRARQDFPVTEVPPDFQVAPGGIEWDADGVRINGWTGPRADRPLRMRVDLLARAAQR